MLVLGLETSCDETSAAVVSSGRQALSNVIHSQEALHARFGGVVPEAAAREHLQRLPNVIEAALERAHVRAVDLDAIAVTEGPGLVGCLLVGVGVAEGLAEGWDKPAVGVNHLWGHIYAGLLADPELEPPLLALVVSGAHTDLVWMPEHGSFECLGSSRDDAAGEAFDKAARMLGLGYPGGPAIDRVARTGDPARQPLPVPALPGYEFSFSGLKTALLYRLRELSQPVSEQTTADLAASFQRSVVTVLLEKLERACSALRPEQVVVCGGVAANSELRRGAQELLAGRAALTIPPLQLCTDNAAMIATAASFNRELGPPRVKPSLAWQ